MSEIILSQVSWRSFHDWNENTDQIDGELIVNDRSINLDIWCASEALKWDQTRDWDSEAEEAWQAGTILVGSAEVFGVTSLILNGNKVGHRVPEAIRRFRP